VHNGFQISTLARAHVAFPVAGVDAEPHNPEPAVPLWERWNDYGIGLLRRGMLGKAALRQAEQAFATVESLGRAEGALNLARVYLEEGRLNDAVLALRRAQEHQRPALPWSIAWFRALVNKQNGHFDEAIDDLETLAHTRFDEARRRGFDFGLDYRLINELGQARFERANLERGDAHRTARETLLVDAVNDFERTLAIDPENVMAHYNLALLYDQLGADEPSARHRKLHATYKPDDNARDRAVAIHRRANPAANNAAEAIVIYDLRER
jgi:tetratricopeptide (TPR) repeat protein